MHLQICFFLYIQIFSEMYFFQREMESNRNYTWSTSPFLNLYNFFHGLSKIKLLMTQSTGVQDIHMWKQFLIGVIFKNVVEWDAGLSVL